MRWITGGVAILVGVMGLATAAVAGNRGLSPNMPSGDTAKVRAIGVCRPAPNNSYSLDNVVIPLTTASNYLQAYEHRTPPATVATATIVQQPKHGVLRLVTEADGNRFGEGRFVAANQLYVYLPDSSYVGDDTATIQVDFGNGLKVNVKYFFQAIGDAGIGDDWVDEYCSKTGPYWKISSTLDANGNSTVNSVEYLAEQQGGTIGDRPRLSASILADRVEKPAISPGFH